MIEILVPLYPLHSPHAPTATPPPWSPPVGSAILNRTIMAGLSEEVTLDQTPEGRAGVRTSEEASRTKHQVWKVMAMSKEQAGEAGGE